MGALRDAAVRLAGSLGRRVEEPALDEEIGFHIEMLTERNVQLGMERDAARRAALVTFGGRERFKEEARDEYRSRPLEDFLHDLRYGIRSAGRAPLFSLLAVATLALGIGANAAVFGVVKSVLLDALPYADADRLVRIYARMKDGSLERSSLSAGMVTDLAARQRSFERLGSFLHTPIDVTYAGDAGPRVLRGALAGPGYFSTLGVAPGLGRLLTDADGAPGAPPVVVISHAAWQREFGGDPRVLGRALRIDGDVHELVGVLPPGFVGPMGEADVVFALDLTPTLRNPVSARKQHWLGLVGRVRTGVTSDAAERELVALAADLEREYPDSHAGLGVAALPLRDAMAGETRTPLLVLMGSAALVLLITCANLASALLSRALSRRREFAVRVAIGAGRGRLVRQLLTESLVLAAAGGAVGLLIASLGLAALRGLAASALPPYADLSLDGGAIAVTAALALLTGVVFGLVPALSAGRSDVQRTLREESRGSSESRRSRHLRGVLVAGQIALSVSLLAGAGLLIRSLLAITGAPLGFEPDGVLTVAVQLPGSDYPTTGARIRFFEQLEERLRSLPGVTAVASTSELPTPNMNRNGLVIEGVAWPSGEGPPFVPYSSVSPDYFRTMGIPLRSGRTFGAADRPDGPPAIVVSEGMAKRYWPNGGAVGARIRLGPNTGATWAQVVGVVGDVRNDPSLPVPEPMSYASSTQETYGSRTYLLRTAGDPMALVRGFERELTTLDPRLPVHAAATLSSLLAQGLAGRRLPVLLMAAFGGLALLLASVGVYAMFASMAAAREREFGVRMALGSSRGAIARLVLRQGAMWMLAGLAGGAVGVVVVARLVRNLLYGVPPFDPVALGAAVATLLVCGVAALLVPIHRATHVDPVAVLR